MAPQAGHFQLRYMVAKCLTNVTFIKLLNSLSIAQLLNIMWLFTCFHNITLWEAANLTLNTQLILSFFSYSFLFWVGGHMFSYENRLLYKLLVNIMNILKLRYLPTNIRNWQEALWWRHDHFVSSIKKIASTTLHYVL